jgi:hypothetical protein
MAGKPKKKLPSTLSGARIKELTDWRDETLARVRALIQAREAYQRILEESAE